MSIDFKSFCVSDKHLHCIQLKTSETRMVRGDLQVTTLDTRGVSRDLLDVFKIFNWLEVTTLETRMVRGDLQVTKKQTGTVRGDLQMTTLETRRGIYK